MSAPGQRLGQGVLLLVGLAVVGRLVSEALVSPTVQFLPPARDARWIVHPDPLVGTREAEFVRQVALAAAAAYPVRVTAMREAEVRVNGRLLPARPVANWKTAVAYDLGPALRVGANDLRIRVVNPEAPPALRVEGPDAVRSDERWTVVLPPEAGGARPAAVVYRDEAFLAPRPNVLRTSARFPVWGMVLAAYAAAIGFAIAGPRAPVWSGAGAGVGAVPCGVLFALVAAVQLHNAVVHPPDQGFDAVQHADYVRYVAAHRRVPDATEGWEMSQPPLYYLLNAGLYTLLGGTARDAVALRAMQVESALTALAVLALGWWMLRFLFPARPRMQALGFTAMATLPVMFYVGPQVGNELLSAFVIAAALCLAMRQAARPDMRWRDGVALGIACGAALLSKYTGTFVLLAALGMVGLRVLAGPGRVRHLAWGALVLVLALALSGWLYVRNVARFGTPFIGAWDRRSGFNIVQPPGYRSPAFYARFGSVFWHEPARAPHASFLDGMYAALWADPYGVFHRPGSAAAGLPSTVILWLGLWPTVAIVLGFGRALRHVLVEDWRHPYLPLVVTTVLTGAALVGFTLEHPFYANLKAHWALSLVPAAGVFGALGLEHMCGRLGRLRWMLYAHLASLSALVLVTYTW